jgi:hypothetical protein
MAETKKGNKIVAVPGYTRKQDGKKILGLGLLHELLHETSADLDARQLERGFCGHRDGPAAQHRRGTYASRMVGQAI